MPVACQSKGLWKRPADGLEENLRTAKDACVRRDQLNVTSDWGEYAGSVEIIAAAVACTAVCR
jgi:hypothetical protein